jgi:hemolysin activation/secretion protein
LNQPVLKRKLSLLFTALTLASVPSLSAMAQSTSEARPPFDAGRSLDSLRVDPIPLPEGKVVDIPPLSPSAVLAGGQKVTVNAITFKGVASIPEKEIRAHLGENVFKESQDLASLREIADNVSQFYRARGFPFARAFLPPQNLSGGDLLVEVYEGVYGRADAKSPEQRLVETTLKFLKGLPGTVIDATRLERVTLLIDDLPGVSVSPVIRPGVNIGEGDLQVDVTLTEPRSGSISIDNHGSRFSGAWRGQGSFALNSGFLGGDQLSVTAMLSNENLRLGSVSYSIPVGGDGLRALASYSSVSYQLAEGFEGFEGTAKVTGLGMSYPMLRSRAANLTASITYQHKNLEDRLRTGAIDKKTATVTPLVLSFDRRDALGAGGITYGALTGSNGTVKNGGRRDDFTRWNLDISRLQAIDTRWTILARAMAQRANANLDSSEGISLGGAQGVRAYPNGEGSGDEGWLVQLEARASLGAISPYAFYDHGEVQVDAKPELNPGPAAPDVERSGLGLGVRFALAGWTLDTALAWRATSDRPTSDTKRESKPRIWAQARYGF